MRVMRAPRSGGEEVDWALLETQLGFAFPSDYRSFMDLYGGGTIDDTLYLPGLGGDGSGWRQEQLNVVEQLCYEDPATGHETPLPYPGRFEVGTLVFWGISPSSDICCWYASGPDSNSWPVVIYRNRKSPEWFRHDGGFADLINSVLVGRIENPLGVSFPNSLRGVDYLSDRDYRVLRQHGVYPRGYIHNASEVIAQISAAGLRPSDFLPAAARLLEE